MSKKFNRVVMREAKNTGKTNKFFEVGSLVICPDGLEGKVLENYGFKSQVETATYTKWIYTEELETVN